MTKEMIPVDQIDEQFFTEFTPEQAEMASGGVSVWLKYFNVKSTQEWPKDEIRLYADNKKVYSKGGFWGGGVGVGITTINKIYEMTGSKDQLTLIEKDWVGKNENLGSDNIYAWETGERTARFTRHGADYTLHYQILG